MAEIKPLGHYVAVEIIENESKTASGIVIATGKNAEFERDAVEFGRVLELGPIAFVGVTGCIQSQYLPSHPHHDMKPNEIWGVNVGDVVEFRRFEGKKTGLKGKDRVRYIPDTQIIGKVVGEVEL